MDKQTDGQSYIDEDEQTKLYIDKEIDLQTDRQKKTGQTHGWPNR